MSQMDAGQPIHEVPGTGYGAYEGNQSYTPPPPPPQYSQGPQSSAYDDEYVDSLAQRLSQRMAQGPRGKVQSAASTDKLTSNQRLALAIVSVAMLVPLAGILVAGTAGLGGLVAFVVACLAIIVINVVFNREHH